MFNLSSRGAAVKMKTADFWTKIVHPGAPEKSNRLFGERRSSGMIESLRKQIFESAGAKDMKLVTTRRARKAAENRQYNQKTLLSGFKQIKGKDAQEVLTTCALLHIICLFVFRLTAQPSDQVAVFEERGIPVLFAEYGILTAPVYSEFGIIIFYAAVVFG